MPIVYLLISSFLMLFFITGCFGSEPTSANLETVKQTNNSNMAAFSNPVGHAKLMLADAERECSNAGYTFNLKSDPILPIDLGGGEEVEAIFDYNALECQGYSNLFCGVRGCPVDLIGSESIKSFLTRQFHTVEINDHSAVMFPVAPNLCEQAGAGCCFRKMYLINRMWMTEYEYKSEEYCKAN